MNERTQNRVFATLGVASVALELGAVVLGKSGGRQFASVTSSPAQVAHALAQPVHAAFWVGAYVEILSFGCFLAFALWACARLGGGLLGRIGGAAATAFVTLSIAALGLGDAIAYRGGKGMDLQLGTALITVSEALYVCSWFLGVFFLLAVAPLALAAGRRALGRSALAVAALMLVLTAASVDNLAQMAYMLWLAWIVYASLALARRRGVAAPAPETAPAV
jgi:hypothetical protein